jgi:hypothetical protein
LWLFHRVVRVESVFMSFLSFTTLLKYFRVKLDLPAQVSEISRQIGEILSVVRHLN